MKGKNSVLPGKSFCLQLIEKISGLSLVRASIIPTDPLCSVVEELEQDYYIYFFSENVSNNLIYRIANDCIT